MASNAGSPSGLTVGQGIEYSAKPENFAAIYSKGNEDRLKRGFASKQLATDLEKFNKDVMVHDAIDPVLQAKSANIGKQAMSDWMSVHQADPTDYFGKIKIANDAMAQQKGVLRNSQLIGDFRKSVSKDSTPEAQQALQLLNSSKNWDEFKGKVKDAGLESTYFKVGDEGEIFAPPPPKDMNETGQFQSLLKGTDIPETDPETGLSTITEKRGKPITIEGGKVVVPVTQTSTMPKGLASAKSAEFWFNHPNVREQMAYVERDDIKNGIVNVSPPDEAPKTVNIKNSDGTTNMQALDNALHEKWFHTASQGNLTKTKTVNVPYTPSQAKGFGYNKGTGQAAGDRFASEKNSEGGGVLSPISGTEKPPQVHVEVPYALKGDATEDDPKYLDKSFGKSQDVSYQSWKTLTNPKTGKKQMFFVVNKLTPSTGSVTVKGAPDAGGGVVISNQKNEGEDQTWLVPAHPDQQKKFFTYTSNKNGTNPHKESFLEDLNKMNEYNNKVDSQGKSAGKKETATPQSYKYKANLNGETIYSTNGSDWVNDKGKKVE